MQAIGGRTITNHPEVIGPEERRERTSPEGGGLLDAPLGLASSSAVEAGSLRVLSDAIVAHGHRVGTLRLAEPLTAVDQAKSSLRRTFVVVGLLALVLAVAVGIGLATLIAAPIRRMTRVAAAVEQGDLSLRAGAHAGRGEVRVLAQAFDHMLERLERAFKRQRDFVSDASHELRTPLAVIRAQVELLDRETDEPRRHESTTTLLRRLDELDRLVGDMLTLASAEAGRLVEPRAIDLDDYFEDLRRDLPLYGERDFQLEAVGGTLHADPDRLTQVLRNLVRNAVAHTEPGDRISVDGSRPRRRPAGDLDRGRRLGHPRRPARNHLRALPSRRRRPHSRPGRQRPRARDRARDRRGARRNDHRRVTARPRRHLPDRAARIHRDELTRSTAAPLLAALRLTRIPEGVNSAHAPRRDDRSHRRSRSRSRRRYHAGVRLPSALQGTQTAARPDRRQWEKNAHEAALALGPSGSEYRAEAGSAEPPDQ